MTHRRQFLHTASAAIVALAAIGPRKKRKLDEATNSSALSNTRTVRFFLLIFVIISHCVV